MKVNVLEGSHVSSSVPCSAGSVRPDTGLTAGLLQDCEGYDHSG